MSKLRVLIVGEMSSAAANLKDGFMVLGHNVAHIGNSNLFRQNPPEINLGEFPGMRGRFDKVYKSINTLILQSWDMVIFARGYKFPYVARPVNDFLFNILKNNSGLLVFWALGCDPIVRKFQKDTNPICVPCLKYDQKSDNCKYESTALTKQSIWFKEKVDVIVPGGYSYYLAYKSKPKVQNTLIPIPVGQNILGSSGKNVFDGKIKIYHAKSRIGFKGSGYFLDAIEKHMQLKSKIDVVIQDRVPLDDHIRFINNSNIVADQVFNQGFGVNSLLIMSMNRLLMAGDISGQTEILGIPEPPMVSVKPNVDSVFNVIDRVMTSPGYYLDLSMQGSEYISRYFSSRRSAQRFIELYNERI